MFYLPRRESREVKMSSGMCQRAARLFLQLKMTNIPVRWDDRTKLPPSSHTNRSTYRPAWKRPIVPFLFKVQQHFAVELVLVQQRFDPVGVVLQILQQHLQIPAHTFTSTTLG